MFSSAGLSGAVKIKVQGISVILTGATKRLNFCDEIEKTNYHDQIRKF